MRNAGIGILFAACILGIDTAALADGVIRDGLGAISIGRGGTNIAHSDNVEIILDNPAGMVNHGGTGLRQLSIDVLATDLSYSDPQNDDIKGMVQPYPMGQLRGFHRDPSGNWALGFGVFTPAVLGPGGMTSITPCLVNSSRSRLALWSNSYPALQ